ncbi:MAG: hypothetical protein ACR2IE_18655 [Candidatus Sumerlaeaceae bacterium]
MLTAKKATTKKREAMIVRQGVDKIEINEAEKLGLIWKKPSAVMTGARKVKSASGSQEEESAAGTRCVSRESRTGRNKVDASSAQTVGFGRGAGTGQRTSRGKLRIATATSGPTSRAEPKVSRKSASRKSPATSR